MKMQLDGKAVKQLISDNPDFELELQRCVVAEVIRRTLLKDARDVVERLAPEAMADLLAETTVRDEIVEKFSKEVDGLVEGGWRYSNVKAKLKPDAEKRVRTEVDAHLNKFIKDMTLRRVDVFKDAEERALADLPGRVERYMDKCVSTYFERDVAAEVNRRIKAASQIPE
tara:strand:- start:235 stop:744 length:510 start_codon:yes stop_codon:yes gene_type:complete